MPRVLQAKPKLAPAHWYRGMAEYFLGNYPAGLEEMNLALGLDPDYALAYADRGLLNSNMGNSDQAWKDWQRALTLDPTLARVHQNMGAQYYQAGDFQSAVAEEKLAVRIDPTRYGAWKLLAQGQENLKAWPECIASATNALAHQPDDHTPDAWYAYYCRALCESDTKQYEAAIADLDKFLAEFPNEPFALYNRGCAYGQLDQGFEALNNYQEAIKLMPTFSEAYWNRSILYKMLGMTESAAADQAKARGAKTVQDYRTAAENYYALGYYGLAIDAYGQVLLLQPGDGAAQVRIAQAFLALNQHPSAIKAAGQALALDLQEADRLTALRTRGRAFERLGRYAEAIQDLSAAISRRPSVTDYYYRGIAYQDNGQVNEALQDLQYFVQHADAKNAEQEQLDDARDSLVILQNG
jgi:tetratricopeptide (TPR) repeat protein